MEILVPIIILAVIGLIAGLGLSLASKYMAVPIDETEAEFQKTLSGANCDDRKEACTEKVVI